jgi:tagatose 6-phosphate kinase
MSDFKPILTVTLNPAIDRMVEIANFCPGHDNRVDKGVSFAGGKGINVSRALKGLGIKSVIAGFAGGANGQNLLRDLLLEGFEHNFVFIQGETRVNLTVRDAKSTKMTRVIEAGPAIDAKDLRSFRDKFHRLAAGSEWTVLSGRGIGGTPKDFYRELVETARADNGKVIVDTSGEDLLAALKGKPCVVRINREEAEAVLKKKMRTPKELRAGLEKLLGLGAQSAIVSLGAEGAVATDGKVFYDATCPKVKALNSVGCGDAMTAGFVGGFRKSEDFLEALVSSLAAGTASCLTAKPGQLKRTDFIRMVKKITIKVL